MYEHTLPDETRHRLDEMAPAALVVGIPSYRNSRTVADVAGRVAAALDAHYAALHPALVHADGHSFDDTLAIAGRVPLPPTVRRVTTRYQGLPGKGSALRAIFEAATQLRARAVLIVEADVTSVEPDWVPRLVEPILRGEVDLVVPIYRAARPLLASNDLIVYPLLASMFNVPLRQPAAGEAAVAGGVATFFAERDVWETDVARAGIDAWMTAQVALGEGRLGQVHLGPKLHRTSQSPTLAEAHFLQEIGTLFRLGQLHERVWREGALPPSGIRTWGTPDEEPGQSLPSLPNPESLWQKGKRALKEKVTALWPSIMVPAHLRAVERLIDQPPDTPTFDERLWARLVYDFVVVYNLGEGDPDKVVTALYPLFLLRRAALLAAALREPSPHLAREQLVQRQARLFHEEVDYLLDRWEHYVSPEQLALWRELGLLRG